MKNMKPSSLKSWQAIHKQLLHAEVNYRKRFHAYLVTLVCLSCVLLVFYVPFFGVRLFAPAVDTAIVLGLAAVIVALTLRQLLYQRRSIKCYLESSPIA